MIEGSNFAECHPVGFRWVMEAKKRGAKIIHVDPRFTRTSAMSDMHVPIRAGSDIAFLGGIVNYIIQNDRYFKEYVVHYTNAAALVTDDFSDTEDLDGLFSGWNADEGKYEVDSWQYEGVEVPNPSGESGTFSGEAESEGGTKAQAERRDLTLQDPSCVFQILKRHFARYTPEMVEDVCGIPQDLFLKVAETLCANSGRERTSAFCYAVGWTQHTVGVQYIRTAAILQLLLGNIGRPGAGSSHCAATPRSRGRPTSPRSTTCCPATCRCRRPDTTRISTSTSTNNGPDTGWWSGVPQVHRFAA